MLEQSELDLIQELPERPIVIDGGAGHGEWTEAVLAARPNARVTMYEPHPSHLEVLRRKFIGDERVEIIWFALSDTVGKQTFYTDEHPAIGDFGSSLVRRAHHQGEIEVYTERLDRIEGGRIDLLKLDVEGAELPALRGLGHLRPQLIQFEYGGTWKDAVLSVLDAFAMLEWWGYRIRNEIASDDYAYRNFVAELVG